MNLAPLRSSQGELRIGWRLSCMATIVPSSAVVSGRSSRTMIRRRHTPRRIAATERSRASPWPGESYSPAKVATNFGSAVCSGGHSCTCTRCCAIRPGEASQAGFSSARPILPLEVEDPCLACTLHVERQLAKYDRRSECRTKGLAAAKVEARRFKDQSLRCHSRRSGFRWSVRCPASARCSRRSLTIFQSDGRSKVLGNCLISPGDSHWNRALQQTVAVAMSAD